MWEMDRPAIPHPKVDRLFNPPQRRFILAPWTKPHATSEARGRRIPCFLTTYMTVLSPPGRHSDSFAIFLFVCPKQLTAAVALARK